MKSPRYFWIRLLAAQAAAQDEELSLAITETDVSMLEHVLDACGKEKSFNANFVEQGLFIDDAYSANEFKQNCRKVLVTASYVLERSLSIQSSSLEARHKYNKEIYWRHRFASITSFLLAHTLLVLGLIGAFIEIYRGIKMRQLDNKRKKKKKNMPMEYVLQVDQLSIRATSLGLAILSIAILFYFLYLRFVYPIT